MLGAVLIMVDFKNRFYQSFGKRTDTTIVVVLVVLDTGIDL